MLIEGTLSQWNESEGVGYVTPVQGECRIRVVRAVFPKDGPHPRLGEELWCEVEHCRDMVVEALSVRRTRLPPPPKAVAEAVRVAPRMEEDDFPAPLAKRRSGIRGVVWITLTAIVLGYFVYPQLDKNRLASLKANITMEWEKYVPSRKHSPPRRPRTIPFQTA